MIARAIHHHSPRKNHPFVKINCTALPENLMESELFGYEKGAFTGANTTKPGKFEQADTGNRFSRRNRGRTRPIFRSSCCAFCRNDSSSVWESNATRNVDVRVVAATNVDLREALEQGRFREDLYYRLNVVPINIPALRERKGDIPFLAIHFVKKLSKELGSSAKEIAPALWIDCLSIPGRATCASWRTQLNAASSSRGGLTLEASDIRIEAPRTSASAAASQQVPLLPEGETLEHWEQMMIREALRRANGNKSQAARSLGLTRNALRYRLSQMGLETDSADEAES